MIKLSASKISSKDHIAVSKALKGNYLGMGIYTRSFEHELKRYIGGNRNVICVNSGTAALHLACEAIDIKKGEEIIVPSITYVASFQAIQASGAVPVACDIDKNTGFIDVKECESKINSKTRAIMPVYYASDGRNIKEIYRLSKKYNLRIIEDAAHSLGSVINGKKVGSTGDIVCFSFDGIKNITSGEGGAVVTNDPKISKRIMDSRLLGVINDTNRRYKHKRSWDFDVKRRGFRYHMSNINAALGISQLRQIENFGKRRRSIVKLYNNKLCKIEGIEILHLNFDHILPHIYVIKIKKNLRDNLKNYLLKNNVETGIHWKPNHKLTLFKKSHKKLGNFKNTEEFYNEILTLPLHCNLKNSDISKITNLITNFFKIN